MQNQTASGQILTRTAGVLLLLTIAAGGFGEAFVPSRMIVSGDAAATARNLIDSERLFRIGFAAYLVEAVCDIALSLVFYLLLRPVRSDLALLAAFFGLVSTALFAVAELFYFAAPLVLRDADYLQSFSADQRNTLALLSLKVYGLCAGIYMVFYGLAAILRGYLIFRSGFLPKFLGVLLALAGAGFVTRSLALVVAPAYSSSVLLLPMFVAVIAMTAWFLTKGLDAKRWEAAAHTAAHPEGP